MSAGMSPGGCRTCYGLGALVRVELRDGDCGKGFDTAAEARPNVPVLVCLNQDDAPAGSMQVATHVERFCHLPT